MNCELHFGMPTLLEQPGAEACAALCCALGLAFVELSMDLPEYQPDKLHIDQLRGVAAQHGIYYTIHLSGFLNPCDFNDKIAAAHMETALDAIQAAKQLGAPVLNMHLPQGDWFTLPSGKVCLFDVYEAAYLQKLAAFRDACTSAVGGADIKICVENTRAFQQNYGAKGLAILLKSPAFAVTFDIGHDAGDAFRQRPVIDRHIDRLCHMHLHDAAGTAHHLPLGEGALHLSEYLDLARAHNCRAVIEVKTVAGLRQSVAWLKERGCML